MTGLIPRIPGRVMSEVGWAAVAVLILVVFLWDR